MRNWCGGRTPTDEDEYRDRRQYDTSTFLEPLAQGVESQLHRVEQVDIGPWTAPHSRLRTVEIYNRGLREDAARHGRDGFTVCLACGAYRSAIQQERDRKAKTKMQMATGHSPSCPVTGWPGADDDDKQTVYPEVERRLHLRVSVQGDVLEIPLPPPIAAQVVSGDRAWVTTLAEALRLGMQLDMYVGEREIEWFTATDRPVTAPEGSAATLVFYDTMPGGTGYLRRLFHGLPDIAARAHGHLAACPCESARYPCLKRFWNQRDHGVLDKRLALPTLGLIAQTSSSRPAPALSQRDIFDSFIEADLFQRLERAEVPRPTFGARNILRTPSGSGILQMDLAWPAQRLVVLLDGREFHSADIGQILADQDKRNRAIASGQRLLEFTAGEVLHAPDAVVACILSALDPASKRSPVQVRVTGALPSGLELLAQRGFAGSGMVSAEGVTVEALAVREDGAAVVVAVDGERWLADATAWRGQVAALRALTLGGAACYRIPTERMSEPDGVRRTLETAGLAAAVGGKEYSAQQ